MRFLKTGAVVLTAVFIIFVAVFALYRRQIAGQAAPGLVLSSLGLQPENFRLTAVFVPAGEFRIGRSRVKIDGVTVTGKFWPPLAEADAVVRGFSMHAAVLRPAAAMEALLEMSRQAGSSCRSMKIEGGTVWMGGDGEAAAAPALRLDLDHAVWNREKNSMDVQIGRLDGQPTRLSLNGTQTRSEVRASGEWNLSGLDISGLLARVGLAWSSRTDVGLLEFESAGTARQETGRLRISSWVLLGKNRPRPFRLSVPRIAAEFSASDSEIVFQDVEIDRPAYDLLGADPSLFKNIFNASNLGTLRTKRSREVKLAVSERHQARVEVLPDTFGVRISHLRIDTGAALAMDAPEHTRFALRITDLSVEISGPASILGKTPNTSIHFQLNGKKDMRWSAITDFSTWPPSFRLTDVR